MNVNSAQLSISQQQKYRLVVTIASKLYSTNSRSVLVTQAQAKHRHIIIQQKTFQMTIVA